jgi:hypothetical protein
MIGPSGRVIKNTGGVIKNTTTSGWNLVKPLPGHVANFTVKGWNFASPAIGGFLNGGMKQLTRIWSATSNLVSNNFFNGDAIIDHKEYNSSIDKVEQGEWEKQISDLVSKLNENKG